MKNLRRGLLIGVLIILYIYAISITSIPDNIILFQGEKLTLNNLFGLNISYTSDGESFNLGSILDNNAIEASAEATEDSDYIGKVTLNLSLFGTIPIKEVSIDIIEQTSVIPLGNIVGLKLYTNGVLVVGMSEIAGEDDNKYKPYENSGIEEGDMIVEVNDKEVTCTQDLLACVSGSNGNELGIKYVRDGNILETSIQPIKTSGNEYKLGLWVRDAAAGVGTVSFYEPSTNTFAALGHGIVDVDTEELLDIATGDFTTTNIVSITKGEIGSPGKIQGSIEGQTTIGVISKNTPFGVFGTLTNAVALNTGSSNAVEVALRDEIQTGSATIICTLENNVKKEYEIEIQKIYKNNNSDNKSMVVKITDQELLEKTGGIIQGMSGSPIIQNGKLVGALTHVLVSDPTQGYAIFADLMIKQMR